ncbi:MAG: sulfotransferase family protein [Bacteroidota bacterium]
MQHSYLLSVISFGKLISLVSRNKGVSIKYLGRFLFLLQGSLWSSLFKRIERIKINYKEFSSEHKVGPVFIIGHWRTGSTFLHQIMSLDNQFAAPSVVQVSVPESFLVSEKYFKKIMSKVIDDKRPMDNVKLGPDEPQEDEYAIVKMVKNTPLEKIFFRRNNKDFLDELRCEMENERISPQWKLAFSNFLSRLIYRKKLVPLLKNPFHSYRIKELKKLFPNAKFIHIYRNPIDVIPSTIRMWNIVGSQNLLAGKWRDVSLDSAIKMFNSLWNNIQNEKQYLKDDNFVEVRFEELEKNPTETIKHIYNKLNLNYSVDFNIILDEFLQSLKSYKKNKYELNETFVSEINHGCAEFIKYHNY